MICYSNRILMHFFLISQLLWTNDITTSTYTQWRKWDIKREKKISKCTLDNDRESDLKPTDHFSLLYWLLWAIRAHFTRSYPQSFFLWKEADHSASCDMHFKGQVFVLNNEVIESNICRPLAVSLRGLLYSELNSFALVGMGNIATNQQSRMDSKSGHQ